MLKKISKLLLLSFLLLSLRFVYWAQLWTDVDPGQTVYVASWFRFTNSSSSKLFVPYSDINWNLWSSNIIASSYCAVISDLTYTWEVWSCSVTCWNWTRSVSCKASNWEFVWDSNCSWEKPSTSCNNWSCYTYSWQTSSWSACSPSCTTNWTSSRSVWCQRSDWATVSDSYCWWWKPSSSQSCSSTSWCAWHYAWSCSSCPSSMCPLSYWSMSLSPCSSPWSSCSSNLSGNWYQFSCY